MAKVIVFGLMVAHTVDSGTMIKCTFKEFTNYLIIASMKDNSLRIINKVWENIHGSMVALIMATGLMESKKEWGNSLIPIMRSFLATGKMENRSNL